MRTIKSIPAQALTWSVPALLLLNGTGCHRSPSPTPAREIPPVAVRVAPVTPAAEPRFETVSGTVQASTRASLEAHVAGQIVRFPVGPGQSVQRGEVLVELEDAEPLARLEQALAQRDQVRQEFNRLSQLLGQQAVTQAEFDSIEARKRVAEAAALEAETLLSFTRVTAPFPAVVSAKFAEIGDHARPGRPLLDLFDPTALEVAAEVPESLVRHLALRKTLPVYLPGARLELEAVVTEIAPAADPVSRTVRILAALEPRPELFPGQFARVGIPVGPDPALYIPAAALTRRGQLEIVFLRENNQARMRLVRTGARAGSRVEILAGLEAGDWVITTRPGELRDGQPLLLEP